MRRLQGQKAADVCQVNAAIPIDNRRIRVQRVEALGEQAHVMLAHLAQRDTGFVVVSKATIEQIGNYKLRMGWRFPWVSSAQNDFNRDYEVSFTPEELQNGVRYNYRDSVEFPSEEAPGVSVFYRDEQDGIFHTYSTYARGLDHLIGAYHFLDLTPKGRDEDDLPYSMAWIRRHDEYE